MRLERLASKVRTATIDYTKLKVNQKVRYTGDMANQPGDGKIVKVRPPDRWNNNPTYDIKLEDGRKMQGIQHTNFGTGHGGHRFEVVASLRSAGSDEVRELQLYIENDGDLYRRQYTPILKNLATKKGQQRYDSTLTVKLFMYLVDEGAKKYAKEFDDARNWNTMFDKATRTEVAKALVQAFEDEWEAGSYRNLLPKKYQTAG
jgi:hypothetical protein